MRKIIYTSLSGAMLFSGAFPISVFAEEQKEGGNAVLITQKNQTVDSYQSSEENNNSENDIVSGWQTTDSEVYYFDIDTGAMAKGWQTIDGKKYYFDSAGALQKGFLQLKDNYYWLDPSNGALTYTGVVKNPKDNKWYFVRNGIGEKFTGWSKSIENGKWYFTRNGVLDWSFIGVAKSVENGKWYHGKNGRLDWNFTGFSKSVENGKWYFSRKGALDWSFTGVAKSIENGKWYFAKKGVLDWGYTGGAKSVADNKWYVVKKGALDWTGYGVRNCTDNKERFFRNGRASRGINHKNQQYFIYNSSGEYSGNSTTRVYQNDPKYNNILIGGYYLEPTGCGPTSLANGINLVKGKNTYTPLDVAVSLNKLNVFNSKMMKGMVAHNTYKPVSQIYNVKTEIIRSKDQLKSELNKGRVVIIGVKVDTNKKIITKNGNSNHAILIYEYNNAKNEIFAIEPSGKSQKPIWQLNLDYLCESLFIPKGTDIFAYSIY